MTNQRVDELPEIPVEEYDGETYSSTNVPINICYAHRQEEWLNHVGYIDNHDGTISCKFCAWGTPLAGYYRVVDGKIIDLRKINRS